LEAGSALPSPSFRNYTLVNPQVGSPRDLGVRQIDDVTEQTTKKATPPKITKATIWYATSKTHTSKGERGI